MKMFEMNNSRIKLFAIEIGTNNKEIELKIVEEKGSIQIGSIKEESNQNTRIPI